MPGQLNLYRRLDGECGREGFEALTTVPASEDFVKLELQGTSADGSKAIYAAGAKLTADAPDLGPEKLRLYYQEEGEGQPTFVCRLPDGLPTAGSCAAGTTLDFFGGMRRASSLSGAMSADGERVYWSAWPGTATNPEEGQIYLRERPGRPQSAVAGETCTQPSRACTLAVSAAGEAMTGGEHPRSQFWAAARDGSRAIFSTANDGGASDLYEFDASSGATTLIAHESLGVMGASEDLARVYLASEEVLSGANAQGRSPTAGEANLYLREGGSFRFLATLAGADDPNVEYTPMKLRPVQRNSRVSADGLHAAFVSRAPLTGYDNTDARSGEADAEVFLYDASAAGGAGRLWCASCNPSGARPTGQELTPALIKGLWAAAWLPVWKTSLYPGRVMSDDGNRLYFTVPRPAGRARLQRHRRPLPVGGAGHGRLQRGQPPLLGRQRRLRGADLHRPGGGGIDPARRQPQRRRRLLHHLPEPALLRLRPL